MRVDAYNPSVSSWMGKGSLSNAYNTPGAGTQAANPASPSAFDNFKYQPAPAPTARDFLPSKPMAELRLEPRFEGTLSSLTRERREMAYVAAMKFRQEAPASVPAARPANDAKPVQTQGVGFKDEKIAQDGKGASGSGECKTCSERKYVDGSNDAGVSFKSPGHINPEGAAGIVMSHEREHVSIANAEARSTGGELKSASISLHTSVCPECSRVYVSGGTTTTTTSHSNAADSYSKAFGAAENLVGTLLDAAA